MATQERGRFIIGVGSPHQSGIREWFICVNYSLSFAMDDKIFNSNKMVSLDGTNYYSWRKKMEDILYMKKYHQPVFNTAKPKDISDEDWSIFHRQVCGLIRQWVDDNVSSHIEEETNARDMWIKLEELYARKTGNMKMILMKQFMALKYQEGTPILDHLNAFKGLVNKLAKMNIKFDDEIQALWLIGTLPDSWDNYRMTVSNTAPNGIITFDLAANGIVNEELRQLSQKGSSSQTQTEVLVKENRGISKSRGPKSHDRGKSKSNKSSNVECHYCGLKGHIKKYCRKLKRDNKNENVKKDNDGKNDKVAIVTE